MKCYLQKINEEFSNEWINYKLLLNNECKKKFNHSGVYIYKDEDKKIAYVGQAGSCTKRLIQHFDHIEFLSDSVVFKVIETTRLDDCEREWISKMKQQGYNLSNKTNGNNPY
jgi:hypothetical protein